MSSTQLNRGSEWRKWDLHVHTPESIIQQFGKEAEAWEKYIADLEALPPEFSVLGINDYLFIDGYERLLFEKNSNGRLQNIDLLLPVVEFRIDKFAGVGFGKWERVNLHVIFSDEVSVEEIKSQFLNALQSSYRITVEGKDWSRIPTKDALIELGERLIAAAPEEQRQKYGSPLMEGFNNLNVSDEAIYAALDKDCFEGKYLIAIGKTEWDELKWSDSSVATKRTIINRANLVFTAAESVEAFVKAKNKLTDNSVNNLLLDCSDAHYFSNSKEKDRVGNCFTWIKADPKFEGLKQVLFEPDDRISIQEGMPEEKNDYQVIESVRFIDDNFTPEIIPINQNLTTIVGGKSTGKSLLLRSIARTIDKEEVAKRLNEAKLEDYEDKISGFSVRWRDKQEQVLNSGTNATKKIIYIPQSYLNRLVDLKEENSSIDEIVKNVLLQTDEIKESYERLESENRDIQQSITKEVDNLFFYLEDWQAKTKAIKEIGDKKGVEEEIRKLTIEIQALKVKAGMAEDEITRYNVLRAEIKDTEQQLQNIDEDLSSLEISKNLVIHRDNEVHFHNSDLNAIINSKFEAVQIQTSDEWNRFVETEIAKLVVSKTALQKRHTEQIEKIQPSIAKVKEASLLTERMKRFDEESEKLNKIIKAQSAIDQLAANASGSFKHLIDLNSKFYQTMFEAKAKILQQQIIGDELDFDLKITFRSNHFQNSFVSQMCNLKTLSTNFKDIDLPNYKYQSPQGYSKDLESIIRNLALGKIPLKGGFTPRDAVRKVLENWYIFDYVITHNGDSLSRMSPGKKSFVLLKLLIELDNSKCPILLDQPEDDLDNRSIYFDLVSFIKSKKRDRQIIIVTHNPNLVVSADAEEVIIANRKGENTPNHLYEFEYASGALEDSRGLDETCTSTLNKQGIREHVCDVLEGGRLAFEKRSQKYNIQVRS